MSDTPTPHLQRQLGIFEAVSANMLEMIGVGPFITIPLILSTMNGPQAMLGWLLGAIVAVCDGLVWAELGAAMPGSGGPYRYLSEAYGPKRLGRLMSFLFIWETIFLAPVSIGAGAVGFAQYTKFLWPQMGVWEGKAVGVAVCLIITFMLYRDIRSVGRLSIILWVTVIFTALAVTAAGLLNFKMQRVFDFPPHAFVLSKDFFVGLGGATLLAMYDYGGYNNACFFAGEVRNPERVIPRSILISIRPGRRFIHDHEPDDHRGGSLAGGDAFELYRFRSDESPVRLHGGASDDSADPVYDVCVAVCCAAGLFAGPLCGGRRWSIFPDFRSSSSHQEFPLFFRGVHRDYLCFRQLAESVRLDYRTDRHSGPGAVHGTGYRRHSNSTLSPGYSSPVSHVALPCD